MTPADEILSGVASAILDGDSVDWASVERLTDPQDRELLNQLRTLARVVDVHRRSPDEPVISADRQWAHLRLIERIGAGAFGEVYRALDTRLDREVALKLLPAGSPEEESRAASIITEGRLLAKVRHPNVVTIHGAERIGDRIGLWMELVQGRTLDDILAEGKRFTSAESVIIGVQLCQAVAAVHSAGMLHRDIKAQNVMLADDGRVVLMDFGTGWEVRSGARTSVAGTPLYLAPELFSGNRPTVQSDIYSLGVLMYRLLTGSYPVRARTLDDLRRAHLKGERVSLSAARTDLPPALVRIIERATDPRPERRHRSASELGEQLKATQTRARWRARAAVLSLSFLVALLASVPAVQRIRGSVEAAAAPGAARPSVAVLGFTNMTGHSDWAWISAVLSEALTTELAGGSALRVVPGERIAQMKLDLSLTDSDRLSGQVGRRVGAYLASEWIVSGMYSLEGHAVPQQIRVDLHLRRAHSGATMFRLSDSSGVHEIATLVQRVGDDVRTRLGVEAVSQSAPQTARVTLPDDIEAARLFAEGMVLMRRRDMRARRMFEELIARQPDYARGHLALYTACALANDTECSRRAGRAAMARADQLSSEERINLQARLGGDREESFEASKTLFASYPDNIDYGLFFSTQQFSRGMRKEARETLDKLRALPPPLSDDPRIAIQTAFQANNSREHERARDAATTAEEQARAIGARALIANAMLERGIALDGLGDTGPAIQLLDRAGAMSLVEGDRRRAGTAFLVIGNRMWAQGNTKGARESFEKAATALRGSPGVEAGTLNRIGQMLLMTEGDLESIEELHGRTMALLETASEGSRRTLAVSASRSARTLAAALHQRGRLVEARARLDEARRHASDAGNRPAEVLAMDGIARLLVNQGDLRAAVDLSRTANSEYTKTQSSALRSSAIAVLTTQSIALHQRGDLSSASRALDEADALAQQRSSPDQNDYAERNRVRAVILIGSGRPADAVDMARRSADAFQDMSTPSLQATSLDVLAQAHIAGGQHADAQSALTRASSLPIARVDRYLALSLALTDARLQLARGATDANTVRTSLDAARREAERHGFVLLAMELELAQGQAEMASGLREAGRTRLAALERRASSMGAGLIVRRIRAVRQ